MENFFDAYYFNESKIKHKEKEVTQKQREIDEKKKLITGEVKSFDVINTLGEIEKLEYEKSQLAELTEKQQKLKKQIVDFFKNNPDVNQVVIDPNNRASAAMIMGRHTPSPLVGMRCNAAEGTIETFTMYN